MDGELIASGEEGFSTESLELNNLIQACLDDFFNDEYEVLRFNINFLESNGFVYQTKINYMLLNRFVSAAFNTIQANDIHVIDGLLAKFYKDVIFLNQFFKQFTEKSKDVTHIFKYAFVKANGGLESLYAKLNPSTSSPKEEELEHFELYLKEEFLHCFTQERDEYGEALKRIINTKTYYFDKLLWFEARKSYAIKEFFKKARRTEGDVNEELSTKIFIKQYLQTIDSTQAKDIKWHEYLENVIQLMD